MRVIGFDPGLSATGFGVIESDGKNNVYHIDNGVLRPPRKMLLPERLNYLYKKDESIIWPTPNNRLSLRLEQINAINNLYIYPYKQPSVGWCK